MPSDPTSTPPRTGTETDSRTLDEFWRDMFPEQARRGAEQMRAVRAIRAVDPYWPALRTEGKERG